LNTLWRFFVGRWEWGRYFALLEREKKKISTNDEKSVEKPAQMVLYGAVKPESFQSAKGNGINLRYSQ